MLLKAHHFRKRKTSGILPKDYMLPFKSSQKAGYNIYIIAIFGSRKISPASPHILPLLTNLLRFQFFFYSDFKLLN